MDILSEDTDVEILDAVNDYDDGLLSYEELKTLMGVDAAAAAHQQLYGDSGSLDDLFDDPQAF